MNFHKISRFIGKHETHFNSFDDAKQLYFASRKYQIQDLESRCLKYISSIANHTNVCQIFEFAQAVSNTELLGTCTNIMAWDIKQVLESSDFLCSKISTLKYIYTMDDLIIDSEIELFKALEKWIQLHIEIVSTGKCVVMCVCDTRPDLNNWNILCVWNFSYICTEVAAIKELIYEIRFMSMTANEFAETVAHSDLLTANEKLGFLSNIVSEKSAVPLPPGFTMKRSRQMLNQER